MLTDTLTGDGNQPPSGLREDPVADGGQGVPHATKDSSSSLPSTYKHGASCTRDCRCGLGTGPTIEEVSGCIDFSAVSPPGSALVEKLKRLIEVSCSFNCDAESACDCLAHQHYRAALALAALSGAEIARSRQDVSGDDASREAATRMSVRGPSPHLVTPPRLRGEPERLERLRQQALFISETLDHAGIGPCTLSEGVQDLVRQRDLERAELARLRQYVQHKKECESPPQKEQS
jgi:hypothetical protein